MQQSSIDQATPSTESEYPITENTIRAIRSPYEIYDKGYVCVRNDPDLEVKDKWLYQIIAGMGRKSGRIDFTNERLVLESWMSERSVRDSLKALQERGLIKITIRPIPTGGSKRYIDIKLLSDTYPNIEPPIGESRPAKNAVSESRAANIAGPEVAIPAGRISTDVSTDVISSSSRTPSPSRASAREQAREDEGIEDEEERTERPILPEKQGAKKNESATAQLEVREQAKAKKIQTKTESAGLSTHSGREEDHPFWAENPRQRAYVAKILELWPKTTSHIDALTAWREVVAPHVTTTPGLDKVIWNGLHWWLNYWQVNKKEDRFIPAAANWIRRERWNDAQVKVATE